MDMSTSLRVKMAEKKATAAQVGAIVGRSRETVARWRAGDEIPLTVAQVLYRHGYLHAEALLGVEAAA